MPFLMINFNCPKKKQLGDKYSQRILRACQCLFLKMWAFGCHGERDLLIFQAWAQYILEAFLMLLPFPCPLDGMPSPLSLAPERWHHNEVFSFDICFFRTREPSYLSSMLSAMGTQQRSLGLVF